MVPFQLDVISGGRKELRWYVRCPVCKQRKKILVYGRAWACTKCHQLHSRSQVVDRRAQRRDRYFDLVRLLKNGRPKGMHSSRYERLCAERDDLAVRVAKDPVILASGEQNRVVTATWMTVMDDWEWQSGLTEPFWTGMGEPQCDEASPPPEQVRPLAVIPPLF